MNLFKRKDYMIKTNTKGFLILGVLIFFLLLVYFISNYNQFTIVKISGNNESVSLSDSNIYLTPKEQKLYIENIKLIDKNITMKSVMISLEMQTDNNIMSLIDNTDSFPSNRYISSEDYFKSFKIIKINNSKILKQVKNDKSKLTLIIIIVDELNQSNVFRLPIDKNILSNNKLFYLK